MLTDPTFARKLLMDYNPKLPSQQSVSALAYVKNRLAGYTTPQVDMNQPQQ
jgi:ribosomal protein S17E